MQTAKIRIRTEVGIITIKKVLSIRITAMDRGVSLICIGDGREQKNTFIKNHPERKDSNRSISGVGRCRVYALCFSYMFNFSYVHSPPFRSGSTRFWRLKEAQPFISRLSITFCRIHMRDSQEWVEEKCRLFIFTEMKTSGLIL